MAKIWKICQFILIPVLLSGFVKFNLSAQTQILENKYSFSFANTTYASVIDSLRLKVKCGVSYGPDIFPREKKYNAIFSNEKLKAILDSILTPINFSYKVIDNNIVILQKEVVKSENKDQFTMEGIDTMKFIKLSGKVVDRNDHKPIEYTNIYIKNRNIGSMTNANGNFAVKLPRGSSNDSIYFSCIGYKPLHKKIGDMHPEGNIIDLEVNSIQLKEIKVKPINIEEVIKTALQNIPQNYSRIPLNLISFYREIIQQNGEYVGLSEAVLNIYKASYNSYLNDQVAIYKGRKSRFIKQMDTVLFKFQGGISTSLMLDIAKNPSNFITDEYIKYYNFTVDDIVTVEGRPTFVIGFDQNNYSPYPLYKGKLYIDIDAYAIVRVDFMISPNGMDNAADFLIKKSSRRLKVKPTFSSYIVNYTMQNNKWYLNYIREEVEFKIRKKYSFYSSTFRSKAEMLITQTDSVDVQRIKFNKTVRLNDIFIEKLGKYDPEFWGGFNIIKPDESLEKALQKIKGKLPQK